MLLNSIKMKYKTGEIKMETEEYVCLDCGHTLHLPIAALKNEKCAIRVICEGCNKDFMLGMHTTDEIGKYDAFTYEMDNGVAMLPALKVLFSRTKLPVSAADEFLKHATFKRWEQFTKLTFRYRKPILENTELVDYLQAHMLLPN